MLATIFPCDRLKIIRMLDRALTLSMLLLSAAPASAQEPTDASHDVRSDRVRHLLVPPKNPTHNFLYEHLQRLQVLERLSRFLSPFRLPREVLLKVDECKGDVNAYFEDAVITVCYEYLKFVMENAPPSRGNGDVRRRDAIVGPTVDVFLHEMGHAVFDLLKIPVFGREEDAADQFSAYIQLNASREEARALILGVAFLGRIEATSAIEKGAELKTYAGEHGTAGQRYFNLLCIAYGFDPVLFADLVTTWQLPKERAESCAVEYQQLDHAFRTLILPHIDPVLTAQVRERRWLTFGPLSGEGAESGR
jgi:hypothetical protein